MTLELRTQPTGDYGGVSRHRARADHRDLISTRLASTIEEELFNGRIDAIRRLDRRTCAGGGTHPSVATLLTDTGGTA
jgi:hypothetical protein